jgi:hypothetical protein
MTEDRQTNPNGDSDPSPKGSGLPHDANDLPAVTTRVDGNQIKQFATQIKSAEQQVGEHILTALQDPETVAVLTAVVVGTDGTQSIVSAALEPEILEQVQRLLRDAEDKRDEEVPCIGFHCLLKRKDETP